MRTCELFAHVILETMQFDAMQCNAMQFDATELSESVSPDMAAYLGARDKLLEEP